MKSKLKELRKQKSDLQDLIHLREKEIRDLKARMQDLAQQEAKVKALNAPPKLTDHVLMRFIERKMGLCLDNIRSEILSEDLISTARKFEGNCTYNGFVIKDNVIITVKT